jgi:hypothetical protein
MSLQAISLVDMISAQRIKHLGSSIQEGAQLNCFYYFRSAASHPIILIVIVAGPLGLTANWALLFTSEEHTFERFLHGWCQLLVLNIVLTSILATRGRFSAVQKMKIALISRQRRTNGMATNPYPRARAGKNQQAKDKPATPPRPGGEGSPNMDQARRLQHAWRRLIKSLALHVVLPLVFVICQVIGFLVRVQTARDFAVYMWITNAPTVAHALVVTFLDQRWAKRKRRVFGIDNEWNSTGAQPLGQSTASAISSAPMFSSVALVVNKV